MNEEFPILIAEQNENDVLLMQRAFRVAGFKNPFHISHSGTDVVDYLKGNPPYADREKHKFPRLLMMALKMPEMDGFELLAWLQKHKECNVIPRIVFSASDREEDVLTAYQLGANSYILKPIGFDAMVKTLQLVFAYWDMCRKPKLPPKC
ncbi:MAG TPA: response regulator [Verrucomicrobiae bacterium]|nr:response regulator [Verrucomicrobiae bacterium]